MDEPRNVIRRWNIAGMYGVHGEMVKECGELGMAVGNI